MFRDVTAGAPSSAGAAGTVIDNAHGGAGVATATAGGNGSDNTLNLRVEDLKGLTVEIVTLKCGECADVVAVARGGHAPYMFVWDDGSTAAQRHVCANVTSQLSVTATDTAIQNAEFPYQAQTRQAQLKTDVLACNVPGMPDVTCSMRAKAGSFDPVVKWSWNGGGSMSTPLVANLTDDNGDGSVDLKDTPDVVVVEWSLPSSLVVLDGRTGMEHFRIPEAYSGSTPALGDIDGDKRADIISVQQPGGVLTLAAFHGDGGQPIWSVPLAGTPPQALPIALADLDYDGSVEILVGERVFDAHGKQRWSAPVDDAGLYTSPTAADLDDDGHLEVIWGSVAYRYNGSLYYKNTEVAAAAASSSINLGGPALYVAIANLEGDQAPEVVVATQSGLFVLDHAGKTLHSLPLSNRAAFPPAIHDLNADGVAEIMVSDGTKYTAYGADLVVRWAAPVSDASAAAAGTAFDFLGDGSAEAMYGDEQMLWGFDGLDGHVIFMQPRTSLTMIEYPSVADVDNDGSADILIVSAAPMPSLQVLSDRMGRWIPARRIMNQDTYHVTNVNEDGTIPIHEMPHWRLNNSFRSQGQINPDGSNCLPKR